MFIQSSILQYGIRKVVDICFPESLTQQSAEFPYWLTFDDGPHPQSTPYLLDLLNDLELKACFFLIGENIEQYPNLFQDILDAGHAVGNHTFSHISAYHHSSQAYLKDVQLCQKIYPFQFFRPPYGRLKPSDYYSLKSQFRIVHWSSLMWDWSSKFSSDKWEQLIANSNQNSDIIVLHDSEKAFQQVQKIAKFLRKYSD